jgi:hypothetical protein
VDFAKRCAGTGDFIELLTYFRMLHPMTRVFGYIIVSLFLGIVVASCNKEHLGGSGTYITENRTEANFTGIENSGDFKVILQKSNTFSIKVHGEDNIVPNIVTSVKDGILKIQYKRNNTSYRHELVTITIGSPLIDHIDLQGSGSIESNHTWIVPAFSGSIKGSGFIRYAAITSSINVSVSGSGFMSLGGNTLQATCAISGSGNIHAFDLVAKEATITISGSGSTEITVLSKLNATINGSGAIIYKGNPHITKHINGSGKLVKQ